MAALDKIRVLDQIKTMYPPDYHQNGFIASRRAHWLDVTLFIYYSCILHLSYSCTIYVLGVSKVTCEHFY